MRHRLVRHAPAFFIAMAAGLGCAAEPRVSAQAAAITDTPVITTDAATYTPGHTIVLSWSNLPGNTNDWVAIAPADAPMTTVTSWMYTAGQVAGSAAFYAPTTPGSYIVRAFLDGSYTEFAESAPFTVEAASEQVATDVTSYTIGQPITVSWTGLAGAPHDWVSIAPAGSAPQTHVTWAYTGGSVHGRHAFGGLQITGTFVARAFFDDSYTVLAESAPFTVVSGNIVISTDQSSYGVDGTVGISWSGLPGGAMDWIAIAPQGAPAQVTLNWTYMGGRAAGTTTFGAPTTPGTYVVRTFANDGYDLIGESAPFTVAVPVTTSASSYLLNQPITVSWGALPPGTADTAQVVLAPAGSPASAILASVLATTSSGTTSFSGIGTEGSYVARIINVVNNTATIFGESTPFRITGTQIEVTTLHASYQVGESIDVQWINLPGNATDWIGIAPVGSLDTEVVNWVYTNGAVNGTALIRGSPTAGTFVARAFTADSYNKVGESAPFVIQ